MQAERLTPEPSWGLVRALRAGFRVLSRTFWGSVLVQAAIWGPMLGLLGAAGLLTLANVEVPSALREFLVPGLGFPLLAFVAITTTGLTRWMSVRLRDPGARTGETFRMRFSGVFSVFVLQLVTVAGALLGPWLVVGYDAPWGPLLPHAWIAPVAWGTGAALTLVLQAACFLATPAVVIEQVGALRAVKRSIHLTRGRRPAVLRVTSVLFLLACATARFVPDLAERIQAPLMAGLIGVAIAGVLQNYLVACRVAAYYDLRSITEGEDPERIAAIFD